jgi:hypothetical protein
MKESAFEAGQEKNEHFRFDNETDPKTRSPSYPSGGEAQPGMVPLLMRQCVRPTLRVHAPQYRLKNLMSRRRFVIAGRKQPL